MKNLFTILALIFLTTCHEQPKLTIGFPEPGNPEPVTEENWLSVSPGLHGSFASVDERHQRDLPPEIKPVNIWNGTGWKGERIHTQVLIWSPSDQSAVHWDFSEFQNQSGNIMPSSAFQIRAVRYVLTDEFLTGCGYRDADTIQAHLVGDALEPVSNLDLPERSTRPLWITIDIPNDIEAGMYKGNLNIISETDSSLAFEMGIKVQDMTLPDPSGWSFHLDLWQNPFAVARYHDVPLWSQEHWELLRPLLTLLANAGQKCITTSIINKPWGGQTYDPFNSMIGWIHNSSGKWDFDYSVFDQYVQFAINCGITEQINCYSMVPWGNQVNYFDEDSSGYITVKVIPGTEEYENLWRPFLYDFRAHLAEMGWLNKTTIAMDERGLEDMKKMISLIKEATPEIKITLAGEYHPEIKFDVYDLCVFIRPPLETNPIRERVEKGFPTTFYTCCARPEHPNSFTFSPPAESAWIGWYAAAQGYSGFLRWAYNSWVEDPLMDTRFIKWPAGDTYFVYPGPRSSIRFERLREGIQDFEKIQILKKVFNKFTTPEDLEKLQELQNFLEQINPESLNKKPAKDWVNEGKKMLNKISR